MLYYPYQSNTQRIKPKIPIKRSDSDLAHGLIAAWLMNEGAGETVYDWSQNNNHITFGPTTTAPIWVNAGRYGGSCVSLDGVDDTGNCPLITLSAGFTISWWWNFQDTLNAQIMLTKSGGDIKYGISDINTFFIRVLAGGSSSTTALPTSVGVWIHFCVVRREDNKVEVTFNGEKPVSLFAAAAQAGDTTIDQVFTNAAGLQWAKGFTEDIRIWNRALSQAEIKFVYQEYY